MYYNQSLGKWGPQSGPETYGYIWAGDGTEALSPWMQDFWAMILGLLASQVISYTQIFIIYSIIYTCYNREMFWLKVKCFGNETIRLCPFMLLFFTVFLHI